MGFLTKLLCGTIVAFPLASVQAQESFYRPEPHALHEFIQLGQTQAEFLSIAVEHLETQADDRPNVQPMVCT